MNAAGPAPVQTPGVGETRSGHIDLTRIRPLANLHMLTPLMSGTTSCQHAAGRPHRTQQATRASLLDKYNPLVSL